MLECIYELKLRRIVDREKLPDLKDTFGSATPPVLVSNEELTENDILRIRIASDGTLKGKVESWTEYLREVMK